MNVVPGQSLHEELTLLVRDANLSPLDALRAATRGAAVFLGGDQEIGTIAAGRRADLILLDADPLADIAHVSRISAVVQRGRLFDRGALTSGRRGVGRAGCRGQRLAEDARMLRGCNKALTGLGASVVAPPEQRDSSSRAWILPFSDNPASRTCSGMSWASGNRPASGGVCDGLRRGTQFATRDRYDDAVCRCPRRRVDVVVSPGGARTSPGCARRAVDSPSPEHGRARPR